LPGPLPRFSPLHLWMALELIGRHGRVGRKQLARMMEIGEGSVRTILERMAKLGLVRSLRGGSSLTEKGRRILGSLPRVTEADLHYLSLARKSAVTVVPGGAPRVSSGIEQRDAAVRAGGKGATVLIFRSGRLRFPDGLEVEREADRILSLVSPSEDDAVLIGFGDDGVSARLAAMAAAVSLLPPKLLRELEGRGPATGE
jgi:DNA-binding MarR family transcriptional regulator